MRIRVIRRGLTLAVALSLGASAFALADTAPGDADTIAGIQATRDLGELAPGQTLTVEVGVTLRCGNSWHVERGTTIVVDATATAPLDGWAVVTPGSIGPVPEDWPLSGEYCPGGTGVPSLDAAAPVSIALTAPTTVGVDYEVPVLLSFTPDTGISGLSAVTFTFDVVAPEAADTTPPALVGVPGDLVAEATDAAGAVVTWPAVTATDDTDPAPAVSCAPASGSLFAVGTTPVTCTATDASGNASNATFTVSVVRVDRSATWGAPLGPAAPAIVANQGRVVPLKVTLVEAGTIVGLGRAVPTLALSHLAECGGVAAGASGGGSLAWDGARWTYRLDTSDLAAGCWRATVLVDGIAYGSAELLVVPAAVGQTEALRGRGTRGGH